MPRKPWKPPPPFGFTKRRKVNVTHSPYKATHRHRERRRKHQEDLMAEQAEVRKEETEAALKKDALLARIEVISNARNDESFVVNGVWALRVFTLVARKLTGDEMGEYPKGEAPLHKIDWSSLEHAKSARDRKAPSLLAIGMVENMLTVKGGWVDLLDRVQRVDGFKDKGSKSSEEESPDDPSHADAIKDLENFANSE